VKYLLSLGIVLLGLLGGAPPALAGSTESESRGDVIGSGRSGSALVVGDSLEVLTSPYLHRHLPGVRLTINAVGGYSSPQIYGLFQQSYDPAQDVIVFDAGTNDNPGLPQILAGRLQAVARAVGDRCMVVPSIHGYTYEGHTSAGKNAVVRAFVRSRPGTQSPDWRGLAASEPQLLQSDHLHPTAEGADARAALIARGVKACLNGARTHRAGGAVARAKRLEARIRALDRVRRRAERGAAPARTPAPVRPAPESLHFDVPRSIWLLLAVSCLPFPA
jgi:hypothetical protein